MIYDFNSKTNAAALTLLSFLFVNRIRPVTGSEILLTYLTLNLNVLLGSITKLSSLSSEKSPFDGSSYTQ